MIFMPDTSNKILSSIATLNPQQLREAEARIAVLLGKSSGSNAPCITPDAEIVYNELCLAVRRLTGEKPMPLSVLLRTRYAAGFRRGSAAMADFVRDNFKPKNRIAFTQAVRALVRILVRQVLREEVVRLSVGPVSAQLGRVAEVVDQQFPGYLACGLLQNILTPGKKFKVT